MSVAAQDDAPKPYRGRLAGWVAPVEIPADLTQLRGRTSGRVRLPLSIYSSGAGPRETFDLDTDAGTDGVYRIVLENGTATDVAAWLDLATLRRRWPHLWLSPHVRAAWAPYLESAFNLSPGAVNETHAAR